jgi:hypothetical protein
MGGGAGGALYASIGIDNYTGRTISVVVGQGGGQTFGTNGLDTTLTIGPSYAYAFGGMSGGDASLPGWGGWTDYNGIAAVYGDQTGGDGTATAGGTNVFTGTTGGAGGAPPSSAGADGFAGVWFGY